MKFPVCLSLEARISWIRDMASPQKPKYLLRTIILSLLLLGLPLLAWSDGLHVLNFLGRFHPLIVHFPIVLILITAIFEWLQGHSQSHHIQRIFSSLYSLTVLTSIAAVLAGYLLYQSDAYEGSVVQRHLWGSIAVTLMVIWSWLMRHHYLSTKKWRWRQVYRSLIFLALFGIIYTAHHGGSITHGSDYLLEPLQTLRDQRDFNRTIAMKNPESLVIYQDIMVPMMKAKCYKCHNEAKTKGGLNMTNYERLLSGGKSEKKGITPGVIEQSEIFQRISLAPDHDDFMPPDGKSPLTSDETLLLQWWIKSGAPIADTLGVGPDDSLTRLALDRYLPTIAEGQLAAQRSRAQRLRMAPKLIKLGVKNGLMIQSDPDTDSIYYGVSMQIPPKSVGDSELSALMPYRDLFSRISLVGADLSEEGLYYLSQMPNLRKIILLKCCIKGDGLVYLKDMPKLETLNLSYTDLTSENAMQLTAFQQAKEIYLFNTFVDPSVVQLLDQYLENTKVCLEEGPYY